MKERYNNLLLSVERSGVDDLLGWLETTDFYTAPCSTRYHLSREGGLLEHSLNVYDFLKKVYASVGDLDLKISEESLIIVALSHDFCKVNFYGQEMRNVKEKDPESGKESWIKKPFYMIKDQFPYGHGEKSALLVNKYIKLKPSEFMAIRWHMGGFTPGVQDYSINQALSEAFRNYPLALLLHMADMQASYIVESKDGEKSAQ